MGKSYNDVKENASFFTYKVIDDDTESLVKVQVGDKFYSPIDLSSFILKELKQRAEHILKTPVTKAVITVLLILTMPNGRQHAMQETCRFRCTADY